ncbi:P-type conjugative transfer protein VirB9 [Xylella fastidiosa]|uniref:P-type conjugative transfer protein VirB9 n=1 Tax=Xylella fastidiosa TaxID=2371 RepID=UPI000FFE8265|nr:P-type conjugative transfer protein VirB9 [Xylella fastidiosa]RWA36995.1 P-type conjugative transfer protein VirB9 [Xylella fastidiosa subsp. multiplex]
MKFKAIVFNVGLVAGATMLLSVPVHAAKTPTPLAADNRVKQAVYDPNQVYEIIGTYGYHTSLEFANDETVDVYALGDSVAWETVRYKNQLFLKPVEPNAATNLTVITDKRKYYFKLSSSKSHASMTFLVRFVYPKSKARVYANADSLHRTSNSNRFDPAKLNLDYGTSGDKTAIPLNSAFDDGQFTYFLFDQNAEIPSVYTVGPDGTESIVNTRREGPYLVVERTASLFTLRNGNSHLCVQNNTNPYKRPLSGLMRTGGRN